MIWKCVFVICALSGILEAAPQRPNPTVQVDQGKIIGTTTKLPGAKATVNKFLSVPFAVSPPERFLPPKAQGKWKKPVIAQELPPACIQYFTGGGQIEERTRELFNNPGGPEPQESEDCLYLNVFAPEGASNLPVLFWIYGGAFIFGSSSLQYYDGSSFATNQDVIVVTHNYRTNVFGYSSADQIPLDKQNAGLYDQRLALSWVRKNIRAFGGDPDKITLFGESAGAISVKYLLASPPSPQPFHAAIMESEALLQPGNSSAQWNVLLAQLGCSGKPSPLKCAQAAPVSRIREILASSQLNFGVVDDGGITAPHDVRPAIRDGTFSKAPLLLGTNKDEGRVFAYILGLEDRTPQLGALLAQLFPAAPPAVLDAIAASFAGEVPYRAAADVITLALLQCPSALIADSLAAAPGYPIYRYLFNISFPNTSPFPDPGVWHTSEIPEVFGTYPLRNELGPATRRQARISRYMQGVWARFARDPAAGPGFAAYGEQGRIADISGRTGPAYKLNSKTVVDERCALFNPIVSAVGV